MIVILWPEVELLRERYDRFDHVVLNRSRHTSYEYGVGCITLQRVVQTLRKLHDLHSQAMQAPCYPLIPDLQISCSSHCYTMVVTSCLIRNDGFLSHQPSSSDSTSLLRYARLSPCFLHLLREAFHHVKSNFLDLYRKNCHPRRPFHDIWFRVTTSLAKLS